MQGKVVVVVSFALFLHSPFQRGWETANVFSWSNTNYLLCRCDGRENGVTAKSFANDALLADRVFLDLQFPNANLGFFLAKICRESEL